MAVACVCVWGGAPWLVGTCKKMWLCFPSVVTSSVIGATDYECLGVLHLLLLRV